VLPTGTECIAKRQSVPVVESLLGPIPEPYDLVKDRRETTNIASSHPGIVEAMLAELRAWQRYVETCLTGADYR